MIKLTGAWRPTDEHICGHEPVRMGDKVPFIPMTAPPDQEWRETFTGHHNSQITELPIAVEKIADAAFREMVRRAKQRVHDWLLRIGGWGVAMPSLDDDIDCVMERGFLMPGTSAHIIPSTPDNCHANAALWSAREPDKIVMITGYALASDGLWREHSWMARREEEEGGAPLLLEPAKPRLAYFGFIRTPEEVLRLLQPFEFTEAVERVGRGLKRLEGRMRL